MGLERLGAGTVAVTDVYVLAAAAVVGPKEGQGPLGKDFDRIWPDEGKAYASLEKAEQGLLNEAYDLALKKAGMGWDAIDLVVGGDLLDQTITTNFTARGHARPLAGVFSACASFTEALALGALWVASGAARRVMVSASSHHLTAERQFRFPLELGYQRPPTAAWTATAAGAAILSASVTPVRVAGLTLGRVLDSGGKDPNDMGSAMAPAAFDTIRRHLGATRSRPADYDAIFTGDLGHFGVDMLNAYAQQQGLDLSQPLDDCGRSLYDRTRQDTHNGGSGPGCSASVFAGPLVRRLGALQMKRLLLVATGALFSPTTYQQGESIPAIAHAVELRAGETQP